MESCLSWVIQFNCGHLCWSKLLFTPHMCLIYWNVSAGLTVNRLHSSWWVRSIVCWLLKRSSPNIHLDSCLWTVSSLLRLRTNTHTESEILKYVVTSVIYPLVDCDSMSLLLDLEVNILSICGHLLLICQWLSEHLLCCVKQWKQNIAVLDIRWKIMIGFTVEEKIRTLLWCTVLFLHVPSC